MHGVLRAALAAVTVAASLPALILPALADATGYGVTDGESVSAAAAASSKASPARRRSTVPSTRRCQYARPASSEALVLALYLPFAGASVNLRYPGGEGSWRLRTCTDTASARSDTALYWSPATTGAERAAEAALNRTPLPVPGIAISPPPGRQVVNLAAWLAIDPAVWRPVSAQASAGGLTVTTTAEPVATEWDMGNGDRVRCDGPGTAWTASRPDAIPACTYTWRASSSRVPTGAFAASVTVVWRAFWTAGTAGGDLGEIRRSTPFAVTVAEIEALNTTPGGT